MKHQGKAAQAEIEVDSAGQGGILLAGAAPSDSSSPALRREGAMEAAV